MHYARLDLAMRSRFSDFQKFCHLAAVGLSKGESQELSQTALLWCDGRLTCNMHASEPSCHAKVHACKSHVVFRCDKIAFCALKSWKPHRAMGKIIFLVVHRVAEVILCIKLKSHCDSDYSSLSWWFGREREIWARNDMHKKSCWERLITLFYHSFSLAHFCQRFLFLELSSIEPLPKTQSMLEFCSPILLQLLDGLDNWLK